MVAVENSPRAFIWARENAAHVGAENLRLVFADLAEALPDLDGQLDVVVSNPPYIPLGAIPREASSVKACGEVTSWIRCRSMYSTASRGALPAR